MRVFYDNFALPSEHRSSLIPKIYCPFFITGAAATGVPEPLRALAVFVARPETVMGLAAWKDVVEWEADLDDERRRFVVQGDQPEKDEYGRTKKMLKAPAEWANGRVLCTLYDIEKMLRMYLSGSTTIYDYLVIVDLLEGVDVNYYTDFAPKLLRCLTNDRHFYALLNESLIERKPSPTSFEALYEPQSYDEVIKSGALEYLRRLRRTLQAAHLCKFQHRVHLRDMLQEFDGTKWPLDATAEDVVGLLDHDALIEYARNAIKSKPIWEPGAPNNILPPTPNDFDLANYWLTRSRFKEFLA